MIDNHPRSYADKIELRRRVMAAVGGRVFDAFAGSGKMYFAVWQEAEGYEGCDKKYFQDDRLMFCCDSLRLMRNIDLAQFSIFDFDTYGSPWEACTILAARRKVTAGERLGLVLTEGSGLRLKFQHVPKPLAAMAGVRHKLQGASRAGKEIAERAISALAQRMNCRIERIWRAERAQGSAMLYFGIVLAGLSNAAARASGCDIQRAKRVAGLP